MIDTIERTTNSTPPATHRPLRTWLERAQRRLWLRRAIPPLAISLALAVVVLVIARVAAPTGANETLWAWGLVGIILTAGAGLAATLRPSLAATARLIDAELDLRERLTTAVDLLTVSGEPAPLADRQLAETAVLLQRLSPRVAVPLDGAVRPVMIGLAGLVAIGGLALMLTISGAPVATAPIGRAGPPAPDQPADPGPEAGPPAPLAEPRSEDVQDVAAELAESRRQQEALDRLADAVGGTAAARDVADALRTGDTDQAAAGLETLARENDQISPQARQQLAEALRSAAGDPASSPLAQAERAAAQGLESRDYRRSEQGLRELAEAVRRSAQDQTPYEDLARALREGNVDPAELAPGGAGQGAEPAPPGSGQPGGQAGVQPGGQRGGQPGSESGANSGAGPGAGSGPGELGNEGSNTRLGVDGVPVELDPGVPDGSGRAPDPNAPPPIRVERGSVSSGYSGGSGEAASTDPVDVADTNRQLPVDARGVVRDYFTPEERR